MLPPILQGASGQPGMHFTLHYHQQPFPEPSDVEDQIATGISSVVQELDVPGRKLIYLND